MTTTIENLGERVSVWLTRQGFTVETKASPGYLSLYRAFVASNPEESISVSQAVNEDRVVIGRSFQLDERDHSLLSALPAQARAVLKKDLVALLNGRAPLFRLDDKDGVIDRLSLTQSIYADGLTKDRVMNVISELYKTQALVFICLGDYIAQAAGLTSKPQSDGEAPTATRARTATKAKS